MRFALLVTLCFVSSALAGYNRRARRGEDGSCQDEFENLSDAEFEELFEKLLMELGEEDKEVTGDGDKVSDEERRALLKQALKELKEVEEDDGKTYSLKINKFAIMTEKEKKQMNGVHMDEKAYRELAKMRQVHHMRHHNQKRQVPAKVNHCAATGPVENQGSCGSCWAFAASHALGGRMRLRDGGDTVFRISEQQATDCTYPKKTGCDGGHCWDAWRLFNEKKISTDFQYPYNSIYNGEGKCEDQTGRMNAFLLKGTDSEMTNTEAPPAKDVNAIKAAVAEGPVVVYMHVDGKYNWDSAGKGVYDPSEACSKEQINHAMIICGYDNDAATGKDYWIVKNSWGTTWGDDGYIKVAIGKDVCGAERHIFVPLLDKSKKTDTSSVCVNAKKCTSNADCSNGVCESNACKCEAASCVENKVCTNDAECGNKAGACQKQTSGRRFARQVADDFSKCKCGGDNNGDVTTPKPEPPTTNGGTTDGSGGDEEGNQGDQEGDQGENEGDQGYGGYGDDGSGYGDDNFGSGYGDDSFGSGYGDDSFGSGYGDDSFGSGYGDDSFGSGYGDDSFGSGYGDDSFGSGYGDDSFGSGYGDDSFGSGSGYGY